MRRSTELTFWAGALAILMVASARAQDRRALASQVRAYIERFELDTAALVADERYSQTYTHGTPATVASRELRADYALIKPAAEQPWIGYRDVFEVDGVPVRERDARLAQLLESTAPDSLQRATAFALESARFNLGPERTVNTPMMPLQLLSRRHAGRIRLQTARMDRNANRATLTFDEPNRPTVVRTPEGEDVWSRGDIVIRLSDGAILNATIYFRFPIGRKRDESMMTVEYGEVPGISLPLPLRMQERLVTPDGQALGNATYSNYRRFQTTARMR